MTILIQIGHGKSDKVDVATLNNYASGAIFCPKGESSLEKLKEVVLQYTRKGIDVHFDPQFYFSVIENAQNSKFQDYNSYFTSDRKPKDFMSPKKILSYVEPCIALQNELATNSIMSPSCIIESFEGLWCQTSLIMAQSSIEYVEEQGISKNLYCSFIISDVAFEGSKEAMDDFITNITSIENLDRIYLIINKTNEAYSQQLEVEKLKNILYLIYSLSDRNCIEIICGYSDIIGLLYLTAGAKSIATGWHQSLRRFSKSRYQKESGGGGKVRQRYTSLPLFNSVLNSELNTINRLGLLSVVLSETPFDELIIENPMNDAWSNTGNAFYHHLFCLNKVASELSEIDDINDRIELMLDKISSAKLCYTRLINAGIPFDQYTGNTHLGQWEDALNGLKGMIE